MNSKKITRILYSRSSLVGIIEFAGGDAGNEATTVISSLHWIKIAIKLIFQLLYFVLIFAIRMGGISTAK